MHNIYIHKFPGKQIRLERLVSVEYLSPIELAKLALSDLFLLASDLFQPLSVDLEFTYCEADSGYPLSTPTLSHPFWLLQSRNLPPEVEINPAWENEERVITEELFPDSILKLINTILQQQHNDNREACFSINWKEMLFSANRVRLPIPADELFERNLSIQVGITEIEHPVERQGDTIWVSGPLMCKTLTAPISVKLTNEANLFTLDLWLHWSLWTDEHGEGNQQVERAVNRLKARQWSLS